MEAWLHVILTSALDGGDVSVSRPGCLTTEETAHGTLAIGGCLESRASLYALDKIKGFFHGLGLMHRMFSSCSILVPRLFLYTTIF